MPSSDRVELWDLLSASHILRPHPGVNQLSAISRPIMALWGRGGGQARNATLAPPGEKRMGAAPGNEIGWKKVAEEIEAVGRSERREIRSPAWRCCSSISCWRMAVSRPSYRSASWYGSIS